jgi:deoxyribodipyrimidine photo-lyase
MTIIYWFRRDRRLSDNPALEQAIRSATQTQRRLLPVTLRTADESTPWGFNRTGAHRHAYETQSLTGLHQSLQAKNSGLHLPNTPGIAGLIDLAHATGTREVYCEAIHAPQELAEVAQLRDAGIRVESVEQSALLPSEDLPFDVQRTPSVFSEFRRQVEKAETRPRTPLGAPENLPALPTVLSGANAYEATPWLNNPPQLDARSALPYQSTPWHGDEATGQAHVVQYFSSARPSTYKTSRNGLIGTDYSTKFSAWLATGALSAAQIWQALQAYESEHGSNDSTYWIWFELLWRDHFRLMMRRFGNALFRYHGLSKTASATASTDPRTPNTQGFERWCIGQTGQAFVDAGMRELAATGYLSNRMRQNVASYLVHDLGGDWRAGAAWFEHCLVDFDVHSNQGNWAYIAGVGTDPRGGRRFNLEKQAHDYDRDASYRKLWSTS